MILLAIAPILGFLSIAYGKSTYLTKFNTTYGTDGTALDTCTVCHTSGPCKEFLWDGFREYDHSWPHRPCF